MNKSVNNTLLKIKFNKNDIFFFIGLYSYSILLIFFHIDLLSLSSLVFVALITFYFSKKYKSLATVLYVALAFRLITIFLGNYLIILPDSWGDATEFERKAWEWSQNGFFEVFNEYPSERKSFHISWILAFFYSLTDRSVIMGQSINLIFGMGSLLLGSRLANLIWNEKVSIKVGWIIALYPTLILYSCLILRESFIWFFLLVALYGISSSVKYGDFKSFSLIFIGFFGASFFHGGMLIGALVFLIISMNIYFFKSIKKIKYYKINKKNFFLLIIFGIFIFIFLTNIDKMPKLAALKNFLDYEQVLVEISNRNIGNANFPEWTVPNNLFELIYKTPIRLIYFMFSPFPWDVSKSSHLIGMLDGLFHLILFILLIKNFRFIMSENNLKFIFLILVTYLIVYGVATGNFGTGIRHRTKFIIVLILLVAPWLPNFVFNKKKRKTIK